MDLTNYNNTNFPLEISNFLKKTEHKDESLKYYQDLAVKFAAQDSFRGLLITWDMGFGKTRFAVSVAEYYHIKEPTRKLIVVCAKSLQENFLLNLSLIGQNSSEHYNFITMNSANMFEQIANLGKTKEQIKKEKEFGMDNVAIENTLSDSLLIVDEAHNIFNAITNDAKNAVSFYDLVMHAKNIKIIFMTGTPIINDPFELIPAFNMLRGLFEGQLLFSEDYDEYENYFISDGKFINKDKFSNRIIGLVSYYGNMYSISNKEDFPEMLGPFIEKIPMSEYQYLHYKVARKKEIEEGKRKFRGQAGRFGSTKSSQSSYRVRSRQISNYAFPKYANNVTDVKKEDLLDAQYSPKIKKLIENINKYKNKGIIYSQFVKEQGLGITAAILEANGFIQYDSDIYDLKLSQRRFAIISGDIPLDQRNEIVAEFNKAESQIELLLLSGTVAEGIDLKRCRHVHILEPFWNYARIKQVITRAIRYKSHIDLPEKERNVSVHIYLSVEPVYKKKDTNQLETMTTDAELYAKSIEVMRLIDEFMLCLVESSIDCSIHNKNKEVHCKLCSPNNMQLFHPQLSKDMLLPNSCVPYKEKKVKAIKFTIDGNSFYKDANGEIYMFNDKINGFSALKQNHPNYVSIKNAANEIKLL